MRHWVPQIVLDDIESDGYTRGWDASYSPEELEARNQNEERWQSQRGRVCEHPSCDTKVRYTRELPLCGAHEETPYRKAA